MPNQRRAGVTPRTVAFPDDLWRRVVALAERLNVTPSVVVRDAAYRHVTDPPTTLAHEPPARPTLRPPHRGDTSWLRRP